MGLGFSLENVEAASDNFGLIKNGVYTARIVEAPTKDTNAGTGKYLNLKIAMIGEGNGKRFLFDKINYVNPNKTAQDIGRATLKAICLAVGANVQDIDPKEFLGKEIMVKVGSKHDDFRDEKINVIRAYMPVDSSTSVPSKEELEATKPEWAM